MTDKTKTPSAPVKEPTTAVAVAAPLSADAVALMIAESKGFLARMQLMTSNAEPCKEGKFPINHFAIVEGNDAFVDLGETVNCIPMAHRPLALEWGEETVAIYDAKIMEVTPGKFAPTGEYARIKNKADTGGMNSKAMYGVQFLLWLPTQQRFATFFCGTITLRNEVGNFVKMIGKSSTLVAKRISNKKNTWYSAVVKPCSEELDRSTDQEAVDSFLNPPAAEREAVGDKTPERG